MTVKIALFLSSDGIALAHRQTAGHWAMIGETAFDVADMDAALADLRSLAVEREGDGFDTLLVLPDDQVLYTSLTAPTGDTDLMMGRIEDGLEGLTPYAVTELEYDWQAIDEDRVKIAVVARETLDEARSFAAQHGFSSKGFAAMPPMERFPGVPTFELGAEASELGFSADGIAFGPDTFGMPETKPDAAQADEPQADDVTKAADPKDTGTDVPPEPAVDTTSPEQKTDAPVESAAKDAATGGDGPAETVTVTPIEDPSVSGPISFIAPDEVADTDQDAEQTKLTQDAPKAPASVSVGRTEAEDGAEDDPLPPAPAPEILAARKRSRIVRPTPQDDTPTPETPKAKTPGPIATETKAREPNAPGPEMSPNAEKVSDAPAQFSAQRGPSTSPGGRTRPLSAPDPERGTLVGQRSARIGLSQPGPASETASDTPATPADTTSTSSDAASTTPTPDRSAAPDATPMPRLAEQLQRVRNASKSRPLTAASPQSPPRARVEIEPRPGLTATGAVAERRPSPFDDPTPRKAPNPGPIQAPVTAAALAPDAPQDAPAGGGLFRRLASGTQSARADEVDAPQSAPEPESGTFTTGLLARKSASTTGGSFKTGLVLTLILLLVLALVAIWSAFFLPNSAVARFFGSSDAAQVAAAAGAPTPDVTSQTSSLPTPERTPEDVANNTDAALPSLEDEAAADGIDISDIDLVTLDDAPAAPLAEAPAPDTAQTEEVAVLPDIDADFDLPPLQEIDQGQNPSPEEAQVLYAQDGIWARSPDRPDLQPFDLLDRVYTASIDPAVIAFDAVALPDPGVNPGEFIRRFPPPPAFGAAFDLTNSGLVAPTSDGVITPDGAFVVLGTPDQSAVPRPREIAAPATAQIDTGTALLAAFRPTQRPGDLTETRERQILGGLTQDELGSRRPAQRPASPQEAAAQASLFPSDAAADPDAVEAAVEQALAGTDLAVARSLLPRARPQNIAQIVATADRNPPQQPTTVAAVVAPTSIAPGPSIPSNSDVSRAATERNAIRLRDINLIGVSGSASDRRGLVRLPSGRFVRVSVGDRLDGGRVAAIDETSLRYVRSGRTVTLQIPG